MRTRFPPPDRRLTVFLGLALALGLTISTSRANAALGDPIPVSHEITIRNGNWLPLAVEDMRRAAGDTAISRLTDAGRLRLVSRSETRETRGALALEISLVGPAETVKLTMTLDTPGSPTLVSTASISVRGLDHAGIFDAFEHVGDRAAERLVAKLDWLAESDRRSEATKSTQPGDPALRVRYEAAQTDKRKGQYAAARAGFEAVAAAIEVEDDPLRLLAEDELRFGLPLFEAQQSLNTLGRLSRPEQEDARERAITRAENLYRQIQAENPNDFMRVADAQRALDSLLVARGAIENAMRFNARNRLQSLRVTMLESVMMEGKCPDGAWISQQLDSLRLDFELGASANEADGARRFTLLDRKSRPLAEILCRDWNVEFRDIAH